jgi:hypothetical protein
MRKKSKRKSKRKSLKTHNSLSLKSESVKKEEKWIIPKSSFKKGSYESKFIKHLDSISTENFKIQFLIEKLNKNMIKVNKDDRFVLIMEECYGEDQYKYQYWMVREENALKYTKKAIEKYGDEACMYILKPYTNFYLIQINDNFTASDFKSLYRFYVKTTYNDECDRNIMLGLPELEGVSYFQWYDIGGVELEKTDYNDFGGNIFIGNCGAMSLVDSVENIGKRSINKK